MGVGNTSRFARLPATASISEAGAARRLVHPERLRDLRFAEKGERVAVPDMSDMSESQQINCDAHGPANTTYICEHLAVTPTQAWFSCVPTSERPWPDAWCSACHEAFEPEGQWNERNEGGLKIKLFCHQCYEAHRAQATGFVPVSDAEVPD